MTRKRGKRGGRKHRDLKQGARPNAATDAARPMAGTSRRDDEPGTAALQAGNDSISGPARDRKSEQVPRRENTERNRPVLVTNEPSPKRSLWSRLNPFSRH